MDAASGRDAEAEDASGELRVRDGAGDISRAQESGPGSGRSVGTSRGRAGNQGSVQSTFTHMVHLIHIGSTALHQDLRVTMCGWKYARWPHARCDDEVSVRCTGAAAGGTWACGTGGPRAQVLAHSRSELTRVSVNHLTPST